MMAALNVWVVIQAGCQDTLRMIVVFVMVRECVIGILILIMMVGVLVAEWNIVQMKYLDKLVSQHEPFTLKGGGLFHLSFGAILTGSSVIGKKD